MKYLLDVNALLAWEHARSPHHEVFHSWVRSLEHPRFYSCALTELGFLRISMQVFDYSLPQAAESLQSIKVQLEGFIEKAPSPRLPNWASKAAKTSDAYLVQLAKDNDMRLATLDSGIKDPTALRIA